MDVMRSLVRASVLPAPISATHPHLVPPAPAPLPPTAVAASAPAPVQAPEAPPAPRSWLGRAALRFACVYLVLFVLPFPFARLSLPQWSWLEWRGTVTGWIQTASSWLTTNFGEQVIGMEKVTWVSSGSGDTTWNYVRAASLATCAVLAAALWATLDRGTRLQRHAHAATRLLIRWYLAVVMLGYGFAKVFPLQFGTLSGERLFNTYGDSSGMNMLWTFLAASPAYTIFGGAMETIGGVLLFFRRTTTLGACVLVAVLANVALLNFCYDVPVKLNSLHYVAMSLFLLLPDWRRLAALFFTHRAAPPARLRAPMPFFLLLPLLAVKLALVGWLVWGQYEGSAAQWAKQKEAALQSPMHGVYEVVSFDVGPAPAPADPAATPAEATAPGSGTAPSTAPATSTTTAPATTATSTVSDLLQPWKRMTVSQQMARPQNPQNPNPPPPEDLAAVTFADGKRVAYFFVVEDAKRTITLTPRFGDPSKRTPIEYAFERQTVPTEPARQSRAKELGMELPPEEHRLALTATIDGRAVHVVLRVRPEDSFLIHGRPFRWIQERPFNVNAR